MKFQVLGAVNLNSATYKTPITTYKTAFSTNIRKKPQKGVFFSPKSPQGTRRGVLPGSAITILCSHQLSSTFWKVLEKSNGGIKVMRQKVSFLAILGRFGASLTLFEPLGLQSEFFQKSKNTISPV